MRIIYHITIEDAEKIAEYRKSVHDKRENKRLYAIELRGRGMRNEDISKCAYFIFPFPQKYVWLLLRHPLRRLQRTQPSQDLYAPVAPRIVGATAITKSSRNPKGQVKDRSRNGIKKNSEMAI